MKISKKFGRYYLAEDENDIVAISTVVFVVCIR